MAEKLSDLSHNLAEYTDVVLYDAENRDFEPAGPFYLAQAQRVGRRVLELGCGSGRYTIPLARAGLQMTGLDVVPEMLAAARRKADALLPKNAGSGITWVEADARTFHLNRQFDLVFESGCTFQHMLTPADQKALLARVVEHLAPGGRFVVSPMVPRPSLMENVPEEQEWFSYTDASGREIRVSGTDHYDPVTQIRTETAFRRWRDAAGQEVERHTPLQLRLTFPEELERLLARAGQAVVERYGGWDKSPLTAESPVMIYVCRRAAND